MKPLLFYLAHMVCEPTPAMEEDPDHKLYSAAAFGITRMLAVCESADIIMSQNEAGDAAAHGSMYLQCLGQLAARSALRGEENWRLRPKCHYLDESLMHMRETLENPYKQSCIMEEDFMGKVKKVASKTHRGNQPSRTLARYLLMLRLEWKQLQGEQTRPVGFWRMVLQGGVGSEWGERRVVGERKREWRGAGVGVGRTGGEGRAAGGGGGKCRGSGQWAEKRAVGLDGFWLPAAREEGDGQQACCLAVYTYIHTKPYIMQIPTRACWGSPQGTGEELPARACWG